MPSPQHIAAVQASPSSSRTQPPPSSPRSTRSTRTSRTGAEREREPLLRSVRSFDPPSLYTLKRRSALVSDLISGRSHSARGEGEYWPAGEALAEEGEGELEEGGRRRTRGKGYDGEFRKQLEGEGGNGVRQWFVLSLFSFSLEPSAEADFPPRAQVRYALPSSSLPLCPFITDKARDGTTDNFHTIDWIHDAIKHSLRCKSLRARRRSEGVRGLLVNLWDGAQGWILVTLIGESSFLRRAEGGS